MLWSLIVLGSVVAVGWLALSPLQRCAFEDPRRYEGAVRRSFVAVALAATVTALVSHSGGFVPPGLFLVVTSAAVFVANIDVLLVDSVHRELHRSRGQDRFLG